MRVVAADRERQAVDAGVVTVAAVVVDPLHGGEGVAQALGLAGGEPRRAAPKPQGVVVAWGEGVPVLMVPRP